MSDHEVSKPEGQSRRHFLAASAAAAAGAMGIAALPEWTAARQDAPQPPSGIDLKLAGYRLDRVEALYDGRVGVEGCDTRFEVAAVGDMNTDVFDGPQSREVSEVGLHPFMLAYGNDGFRDYSLLPVFPIRVFRHRSVFIRTDRGIEGPADLRGKRVATPGFSSTSLTWLRGIFQHEYGVSADEIEWVVSAEDSSEDAAGKVSRQESVIPPGLTVGRGPVGLDESDLLETGEVDALFHAAEPRAYIQGDPSVARLFSDYRSVERAYYEKTGIFPIMHAVAIRNDVADAHPWLPEAVFRAYSRAKQMMYMELKKLGWATISLPWAALEVEETTRLMGQNYWPYGIPDNRLALEALCRYSHEQGLASRELSVEELFHPATLDLDEA